MISVTGHTPTVAGNRLVINHQFYFIQPGRDAQMFQERESRALVGDDMPYQRPFSVTTEITPLDFGWIERPSLVIVTHKPIVHQVMPSREVQQLEKDRRILIWFEGCPKPVAALAAHRAFSLCCYAGSHDLIRVSTNEGVASSFLTAIPE